MTYTTSDTRTGQPGEPPERSARRWPRVLVVLLVVVIGGRFLFTADASTDVMALPEAGLVRAGLLDDGTPVFLVNLDEESVHVVEALTPAGQGPVRAFVGWCPQARQFVDPHLGTVFDPSGQRFPDPPLRARTPEGEVVLGSPGFADDLAPRAFERTDGGVEAEDPVLIGGAVERAEDEPRPPLLTPLAQGLPITTPVSCQRSPAPLVEPVDRRPLTARGFLDHSFLAGLLRTVREGWQITDGFALIEPSGEMTWCRVAPVGLPPSCPDVAPVTVDVPMGAEETGGAWTVLGGPLGARVADGSVVELASLPTSTWRGGSLRGTVVLSGVLQAVRSALGEAVVTPDPGSDTACGEVVNARGVIGVDVDADTMVDVDGEADLTVLGDRLTAGATGFVGGDFGNAVPPLDPPKVEIVLDAVTCAALSLRSV